MAPGLIINLQGDFNFDIVWSHDFWQKASSYEWVWREVKGNPSIIFDEEFLKVSNL